MIPLRAGELRRVAYVQRNAAKSPEQTDAYGEQLEDWRTIGKRRAKVEPLSGQELFEAQQVFPATTHRVTVRYFAGLLGSDRLVIDGRVYEIGPAVDVEMRHRELVIPAISREDLGTVTP